MNKLLVVDIAALGWDPNWQPAGLEFHAADSIFPALTCPVQASFRTASAPSEHGMVASGLFFKELRKVLFWEQAASLVEGKRIWENFRARGRKVGMMFWQQSLGEAVDLVLSPAPIHKHSGGMIQDCYSLPRDLYPRLVGRVGRSFNLMNYWGPLASRKSSDWIMDATCAVMETESPDLLLSYIPHLDYDLQRHGPASPKAAQAREVLAGYLQRLRDEAKRLGYEFLFFGDYSIEAATGGAVFPNRRLREAGLFPVREIKGMMYADLFSARAFAMVDHQVAHVYTDEPAAARKALEGLPGIAEIRDGGAHRREGALILVAEPGHWFAYPWWSEGERAPDYATHVDIHNKPGFDPCELFFGWPPLSVSRDTRRVGGTHGRPGSKFAWSSSLKFPKAPGTLLELAAATRDWLNAH